MECFDGLLSPNVPLSRVPAPFSHISVAYASRGIHSDRESDPSTYCGREEDWNEDPIEGHVSKSKSNTQHSTSNRGRTRNTNTTE